MALTTKVIQSFVVLSCVFLLVSAFPPLHSLEKRGGHRFCGRVLVEALAMVCEHYYYDPDEYEKRSSYKGDWSDEFVLLRSKPKIPESKLLDSSEEFDRDKRGVIDECCKKSCSFQELAAYCY